MSRTSWTPLLALMLVALGGQSGDCANLQTRKLLGSQGTEEDMKVTAMIANGQPATTGQFPFFASLHAAAPIDPAQGFYQYCGGTLVAERVVLTAAHCLFDPLAQEPGTPRMPARVTIGATDATDPNATTRRVVSMVPHPSYDNADLDNKYDVGLLLLDQPVTGVPFATLANNQLLSARRKCRSLGLKGSLCAGRRVALKEDQPLTVVGFGSTATTFLSKHLLYTTVEYVGWKDCQRYYDGMGVNLHTSTMCAGSITSSDACVGDSGGPLMTKGSRPVQVGVVSFGPDGCGSRNHIGAYGDVASMHDWILNTIHELSAPPAKPTARKIT